jgi:ring-1,2-phenylacetyl-CoA epoxidase subunit PaaD
MEQTSPSPATIAIFSILAEVPDPEIPVLNILDLGIVRKVIIHPNGHFEIVITPTYSGCPAMDAITVNIRSVFQAHGFGEITVTSVLEPAWTTDWISEAGRQKLLEYGIAPPVKGSMDKKALFFEEKSIPCPRCKSIHTEMISQFGSTACKALYKCLDCLEPFDYFKCH